MTKAELAAQALEALDSGDTSWDMWLFENDEIIREALRQMANFKNV
jgi:hypothetical protein